MNAMQKAVVKNMEWANSVPTYQVSRAITTDELDALYKQVKSKGVTMSALLAKAVGMTLAKHPLMNAAYVTDGIQYNENINVAMAVAMPDGGLITPTLQKADQTDLYSMSRNWKDLVGRAFEKKLTPDEYTTGTFTISNLGMYGIKQFCAIVNPPQACILAVGGAQRQAVMDADTGAPKEVQVMTVTLSCDHRVVDGAVGAQWLQAFKGFIEAPLTQLL